MIPKPIPQEAGCCSVLRAVIPGGEVEAIGNVPAGLQGTKWPDVRVWTVFCWFHGIAFVCEGLKTENEQPWPLGDLLAHCATHSDMWRCVKPGLKP